jgi:hypothetical protein
MKHFPRQLYCYFPFTQTITYKKLLPYTKYQGPRLNDAGVAFISQVGNTVTLVLLKILS